MLYFNLAETVSLKKGAIRLNLVIQKCIGNNLKALRGYHGLSQQLMAETVGITRSLYAQYELGNRSPDAEVLFNIAQCFGVEMSLLFERDSDTFLNGLTSSQIFSRSASNLLGNYNLLSPFSKGRLVEYSEKLLEWDSQKASNLRALEKLSRAKF